MYATATITKDHIKENAPKLPGLRPSSEKGRTFKVGHDTELDSPETTHLFTLLDDDGDTYYSGTLKGDEEGVADLENTLFDWGAGYAGTAALFVDGDLVIG